MHQKIVALFVCTFLVCAYSLYGLDITLSTADIEALGGLRDALNKINATPSVSNSITIPFTTLTGQQFNLPPIEISSGNSLTIDGPSGDATLNGGNVFRGFFLSSGNLTINQMEITNTQAIGGNGGTGTSGGGGGLGAGGAFFVRSGCTLTLNAVTTQATRAQGGSGGNSSMGDSPGGGGGMGGSGGAGIFNFASPALATGGGGGGLYGAGAGGDDLGGGVGGGGLFGVGGFAGGTFNTNRSGGGGGGGIPVPGDDGQDGAGAEGGNGGGTNFGKGGLNSGNPSRNGQNGGATSPGGGGGGGAGGGAGGTGGNGGYAGGGGGGAAFSSVGNISGGSGGEYGGGGSSGGGGGVGVTRTPGVGGFGGGGAGASMAGTTSVVGGMGGFGGGAGGSVLAVGANGDFGGGGSGGNSGMNIGGFGGFGGGHGGSAGGGGVGGGGGGAALGGALFIEKGGSVLVHDGTSFSTSSVISGLGGAPASPGSSGFPGQALGVNVFMMASAQLTFDITDAIELPFGIAGDGGAGGGSTVVGGLTKQGSGTVTLGGTGTYSGFTNVDQGTLLLNGSIITPTLVGNGGTLQGGGTVNNSVSVENGGTLFPGSAITTFHANSLQLFPLSTTVIEVNDTEAASLIEITGAAVLDGTLFVNFAPGNYTEGQLFTILEAEGGVSGQFTSTLASSGMEYEVIYSPQFVQIHTPCFPIPAPPLSVEGLHGNARRVANYLNSIRGQPFIISAIRNLGLLSSADLDSALKSISPGRNAFSTYIAQDLMFSVNKVATSRMSAQRSLRFMGRSLGQQNGPVASLLEESFLASGDEQNLPRGSTMKEAARQEEHVVWATGLGEFVHQNKQEQNPAFGATSEGALIGFETYQFSHVLLGATAGYAHTQINMDQDAGSGMTNYYFAALYATSYLGDAYLEFSLWGGYDRFKNKRHIVYPGFDATAHSSHTGWQIVPSLSLGYDVSFGWGVLEPFASLDAAVLVENRFSEKKASPYNVEQVTKTSEFLRFETGMRGYQLWQRGWGSCLIRETLSYVLRQPYHVGTVTSTMIGAPGAFTVYSFTERQNILSPGLELFLKHKKGGFISATYSGEFSFGTGYLSNEIIGKVGVYF